MRKLGLLAMVALSVGLLAQTSGATSNGDRLIEFDTMIGVTAPFTGNAANAINGVTGAGAAWRLDRARGDLRSSGRLKIDVEGLVLVSNGTNPQDFFRGVVACKTIVGGQAVNASAVTGPFPATDDGDSRIDATVAIPSPCFNPAVFVTTGAGDPPRWFAVTGQ